MFPKELAELVPWIVFLLPGWLTLAIAVSIADLSPTSELYTVFASFMLSSISYAISSLLALGYERASQLVRKRPVPDAIRSEVEQQNGKQKEHYTLPSPPNASVFL